MSFLKRIFTRVNKRYVSDTDKFMASDDTPLSQSQKREIAKHERIGNLRDNKQSQDNNNELWKDF